MCSTRKRFTIGIALIASLLLCPTTFAAQGTTAPDSDWSRLTTVAAGSKLAIKLRNGKTVEGKLSSVSDTALSLSVKDKPVDLKRDDVLSVYQINGKSATKSTLIGLGVGAGAGAAVGAASGDSHGFFINRAQLAAGLAVLAGGVGALTGYLVGRSGRKRVLIYQAKQP